MGYKKAVWKSNGEVVNLIQKQSDIDFILSSKGYFGPKPQIGYYSLWLGASDGGYLILTPDEVEIKEN